MIDYIFSQNQSEILFKKAENLKCLTVQIFNDSMEEDDETFQLLISHLSPVDSRMQLHQTITTLTIVNDDIGKFSD